MASSFIEERVAQGKSDVWIEREVLRRQNSLTFDLKMEHPFAFDGMKKESDRIRHLVWNHLQVLKRRPTTGVQAFSAAVDATSFEVDTLRFSRQSRNRSRLNTILTQSFEETWDQVERLAASVAWKVIRAWPRLEREDLADLMQAGRIAVWECRATYDGSSKFSTYAHNAIYFSMLDYAKQVVGTDEGSLDTDTAAGINRADDPAEIVAFWRDLIEELKRMTDGPALLMSVLGFSDEEIGGSNVAGRRQRTRAALRASAVLQ